MSVLSRSWGDLLGIAVAIFFIFAERFAEMPSKSILDAVAVFVILLSAARIVLRWRRG